MATRKAEMFIEMVGTSMTTTEIENKVKEQVKAPARIYVNTVERVAYVVDKAGVTTPVVLTQAEYSHDNGAE